MSVVMYTNSQKTVRLLRVYLIISQYGSEEMPIGTEAIREKLAEEGLACDRRTIYADIDTLNKCGFEVLVRRGRSNLYYIDNKEFDIAELIYLIDAVQAAHFIPRERSQQMIAKISRLAGANYATTLEACFGDIFNNKNTNDHIFYTIDTIADAITSKRMISFNYFDLDANRQRVYRMWGVKAPRRKEYKVSPICTVIDRDHYYLICYDARHKNISHYRLDRMDNVEKLKKGVPAISKTDKEDIAKYKSSLFDMYHGEKKDVTFEANKELLNVIYDKFGDNVKIEEKDEQNVICEITAQISPCFYAWFASFGTQIKLLSPDEEIKKMRKYLRELNKMYYPKKVKKNKLEVLEEEKDVSEDKNIEE